VDSAAKIRSVLARAAMDDAACPEDAHAAIEHAAFMSSLALHDTARALVATCDMPTVVAPLSDAARHLASALSTTNSALAELRRLTGVK